MASTKDPITNSDLPPTNDNSNPQGGSKYKSHTNPQAEPKENDEEMVEKEARTDIGLTKTVKKVYKHMKVPPTKKDARKLFVGGIASNVSDDDFREFFEQYGTVVDSVVMFDKETKRSRGFGFVTFEEVADAQAVLNKARSDPQTMKINGKVCEVKPAEPKATSQGFLPSFSKRLAHDPKCDEVGAPKGGGACNVSDASVGNRTEEVSSVLPSMVRSNAGAHSISSSSGHEMGYGYGNYFVPDHFHGGHVLHPPHTLPVYGANPGVLGGSNFGWQNFHGSPMYPPNSMVYYPSCFAYNPTGQMGHIPVPGEETGLNMSYLNDFVHGDQQGYIGYNPPPVCCGALPYHIPVMPMMPVSPALPHVQTAMAIPAHQEHNAEENNSVETQK